MYTYIDIHKTVNGDFKRCCIQDGLPRSPATPSRQALIWGYDYSFTNYNFTNYNFRKALVCFNAYLARGVTINNTF